MFRFYSLVAALAVLLTALCASAHADPDRSVVRVTIDKDGAHIAASGRTRVDIVGAVLDALEKCELPTQDLTVGPWLLLPECDRKEKEKRPQITVCVSDEFERGSTTAYVAVSSKLSFKIVTSIASELGKCGYPDVRLLSHTDIMQTIGK